MRVVKISDGPSSWQPVKPANLLFVVAIAECVPAEDAAALSAVGAGAAAIMQPAVPAAGGPGGSGIVQASGGESHPVEYERESKSVL